MKLSSSLFLFAAASVQHVQANIDETFTYTGDISDNNKCWGLEAESGKDFGYGFKMNGCTTGTFTLGSFTEENNGGCGNFLTLEEARALEVTVQCYNKDGTEVPEGSTGGAYATIAFSDTTIDIDVGTKGGTGGTLFDVSPSGTGNHRVTPVLGCNGDNSCVKDISHLNFCIPCTGTEPSSSGDPHFVTWNSTFFDFMGACDLKLINAPFFAPDLVLDIDIRTTLRYQYSYIESAAIKIGENTLEVSSYGDYSLDGVSRADMPNKISGFAVEHSQPNKNVHVFEIILNDDEKIIVKTFKDMVAVKLHRAKPERFHGSQGMLGAYDQHGMMLGRDGATLLEDPNAFAAEWQIRDTDPMIFQSVREPQFPHACQLPTISEEESRRRLAESSITMEDAEEACASWPKDFISGCIHDVLATQDLELASAGAF